MNNLGHNTMQKVTNYQTGETYALIFGENVTTGIVSLYCVPCQFDEGLTTKLGTILSNAREKTRMFKQDGRKGSYIYTNEMDNAKTINLTYTQDAIYWQNQKVADVDKDLLANVITAETWMDGNDQIVAIGTNGTKMYVNAQGATAVSTYLPPSNLFKESGKLRKPQVYNADGSPVTEFNTEVDGSKKLGKTFMVEAMYYYDDNTVWGVRLTYCMNQPGDFTDGQGNKMAFVADVYCDSQCIDKPFVNGLSNPSVVATTGTDSIYRVNADYMIKGYSTYSTGTVAVATTGVVTGAGTTFTAAMVGGIFTCDGNDYVITTFTSATSITVATPPASAIVAGTAYTITSLLTTVSAPTFAGASGEIAVVVATGNGKVGIYKNNGTNWSTAPVTSTLGVGCQIYGAKVGTSLSVLPTAKSGYIAIATAGVSGSAIASTTKTAVGTTPGTEDYVLNIRYFNLGTLAFEDYTM